MLKILIVDDDVSIRESLRIILKDEYEILDAETGREAVEMYQEHLPELVLLDIILPDMDGLEILKSLKISSPDCTVVMLSGIRTIKMVVQAMRSGAEDYIAKPFDVNEIKIIIQKALEKNRLLREVKHLRSEVEQRYSFGNVIGKSKAMKAVYTTIKRIADKKSTVLITGESGTGKELIAKAIHYNSGRKDRPFISVNCAAIPETLIESEMFGHEKGAFTDAHHSKVGQFELANSGTILLDEIGELSLYTQAKLLRVLQEREFLRVGGVKKIKVDIRVIASTNQDLLRAIDEKRFREDLYYRINVLPVALPALRDRTEDLPLLMEHFLNKYLEKGKKLAFSKEAMRYLIEYDWPGNVRELENLVERTVVLHQGAVVEPDDLPPHIQENGRIIKIREEVLSGSLPLERAVEVFERDLIVNALKRSNLVQIRTAKKLGISRRMLKYKIDKYGIDLKSEQEED